MKIFFNLPVMFMLFCDEKQHLNEVLSKLLILLQYTPTRVGKSQSLAVPDKKDLGYSHSRGKKVILRSSNYSNGGTLPRVWEKANEELNFLALIRYTPTCVGKSVSRSRSSRSTRVHSHSRGKKYKQKFRRLIFIGTLPLAWEKVLITLNQPVLYRYTPTRVGKRLCRFSPSTSLKDYSHSRGKKSRGRGRLIPYSGILPLAWEKVDGRIKKAKDYRYTPTRVGKRLSIY